MKQFWNTRLALTLLLTSAFFCPLVAQNLYAQNPYAKKTADNSIGFQVGYTRDLLREKTGMDDKKLSSVIDLNGAKLGIVYDGTIIKGFGVSLALNYSISAKKDKWIVDDSFVGVNHQKRDSYVFQQIEIPIDWQYKFEIAKETYLILYTGPTIQYNFYFKQTTDKKDLSTNTVNNSAVNRYQLDNDKDDKPDYTPLNITWGIGAGFQYQRYFLRGGYDFGIYNPYKDRFFDIADGGYYNRGRLDQWTIKIGMYLWQF